MGYEKEVKLEMNDPATIRAFEKLKTMYEPSCPVWEDGDVSLSPTYPDWSKIEEKQKKQEYYRSNSMVDNLSTYLEINEIPSGMYNQLLKLAEYNLYFLIDDSKSMNGYSSLLLKDICPKMEKYFKDKEEEQREYIDKEEKGKKRKKCTRWEEVQDRLYQMVGIIEFLPCSRVTFAFFNGKEEIAVENDGVNFGRALRKKIDEIFSNPKLHDTTPTFKALSRALSETDSKGKKRGNTAFYVFTDGEPNVPEMPKDEHIDKVCELVLTRENPERRPVTFLSCTSKKREVEWLKFVEAFPGTYMAELDEIVAEQEEVKKKQGPGFMRFSRGMYIVACIAAALDPVGLDNLDEEHPFTRKTLSELRGLTYSEKDYLKYFQLHPGYKKYRKYQAEFLREDISAFQIVKKSSFPFWCCDNGEKRMLIAEAPPRTAHALRR